MQVATVRVRDDYSPQGFKIINESDLNEFHEVWPEQVDAPPPNKIVLRDGDVVTFKGTEFVVVLADGAPSLSAVGKDVGGAEAIQIPKGWQSMHWKSQVKLAKSLGYEGQPTAEQAKAFIASALKAMEPQ